MNAKIRLQNLEQEVAHLQRALQELSVLNELATAINSTDDMECIMRTIIKRSLTAVKAQQATVTLVDTEALVPAGTIVREMGEGAGGESFHLDENLLGRILHTGRPLMVNQVQDDPQLCELSLATGIHNLIAVPLQDGKRVIGVLIVFNKNGKQGFDSDDLRLLTIIASQSAQVLDRARLHELEHKALEMQEELGMAEKIQMRLLPSEPPLIKGYDVAGASVPAFEVGGDYYDFIPLDGFGWALALGDISGKGLPAALLMANLQATLRGQVLQGRTSRQCLQWCNKLLHLNTPVEKFATLFFGQLNPKTHRLTYGNAGHEHPFLIAKDGSIRRLKEGGLPLGILEDFDFIQEEVGLVSGDLLVIHSDGVTDMENPDGDTFGEARLKNLLLENRTLAAEELVRKIINTVQEYAGSAAPFDDLTVVVLRRLKE